jgi:hypothetical protein
MNKKIMRIATLSIALMGALLLLSNTKTNAAETPVLTLTVSGGAQTCNVGMATTLGSVTTTNTTGYLSGNFMTSGNVTNTWKCTDFSGSTARNLQVSSANLVNAAADSIANTNVKLWADAEVRNQGNCNTG